jgi:ParB family chromosome partitioning protein
MAQNFGLGRGLSSLIPPKKKINEPEKDFNYFGAKTNELDNTAGKILEVEISRIVPNPHQPRKTFNEEKLQDLANSIKENGIIQPLVVSQVGGQYELIAGERRFQAAKIVGLEKVPVIVKEVDDQKKLELAIVENIQRHDLNPIEEAKAYKKLAEEFGLSQEEVAQKIGVSRSAVANKFRLLSLPIEIQKALIEGIITEGHAKAILSVDNPEKQRALFEMILKNKLTVRQLEDKTKEISVRSHKRSVIIDPEIKNLEDQLSEKLKTKVKISKAGSGGKIIIEYYSPEELEGLLSIL